MRSSRIFPATFGDQTAQVVLEILTWHRREGLKYAVTKGKIITALDPTMKTERRLVSPTLELDFRAVLQHVHLLMISSLDSFWQPDSYRISFAACDLGLLEQLRNPTAATSPASAASKNSITSLEIPTLIPTLIQRHDPHFGLLTICLLRIRSTPEFGS